MDITPRSAGLGSGGERVDPLGEVIGRLRGEMRRPPARLDHQTVLLADHLRQRHVFADHLRRLRPNCAREYSPRRLLAERSRRDGIADRASAASVTSGE